MEEFVREKIKDKPLNKRRIFIKLGISALSGLIFGIVACIVFAIYGIELGKNQQAELQQYNTVDEQEEIAINIDDLTETTEDTEVDSETEVVKPEVPVTMDITLEGYQKIQSQLYAIANTVNKSIVAITSVSSDTDWFDNSYETEYQGAGVIICDGREDLLILTEKKVIQDANMISVTFINDDVADATVRKVDSNIGIAVLTVKKSELEESTLESVKVANLGNSSTVTKGSITIALGSPLGTCYSILTGNITSNDNEVSTLDCNYPIFTTDIVASEAGSGILINVKGEVTGIIKQEYGASSSGNTLTAIGISEVRPVIDLLLSSKDVPYLGVLGSSVTDKIARKYTLPRGVYVKEVKVDSPAMVAGILSGDVITEINGTKINSVSTYYTQLLSLNPGEEYSIKLQRKSNTGYKEIAIQVIPGVLN